MAHTEFKASALLSAAFADLNRVKQRPSLVYILAGIFLLGTAVTWIIQQLPLGGLASVVAVLLGQAGVAYLAAPVTVALHRFAASGGNDDRALPGFQEPAARKFWAWSVVLLIMVSSGSIVTSLSGTNLETPQAPNPDMFGPNYFLALIVSIAVFIAGIRLMPLLPMAALDPDQSSISRAWELSRGKFWTIFGALLLLGLAVFVSAIVVGLIVVVLGFLTHPWLAAAISIVLFLVVQTIFSAGGIFLATHTYLGLTERLEAE